MTLAGRLKQAREALGMSQKEMAKALGIAYTSWIGYEDGANVPGGKVLEGLGRQGINVNWVLLGAGVLKMPHHGAAAQEPPTCYAEEENPSGLQLHRPPVFDSEDSVPEGYVRVPRYRIAASAGGGSLVQSEQVVDYLAFRGDWLKLSLGVSPGRVAVISVVGDSMYPYLEDGDLILVDLGVTRFTNDAVYILQYDDSLLVKRIQRKGDGTVVIKGDNRNYEPELLTGDAVDRLRVVGRMLRRLVR